MSKLGQLSAKYESNGSYGIIANNPGDQGGKSYGKWQIIKTNLPGFLKVIKNEYPDVYEKLSQHEPGSKKFDDTWRQLGLEKNKKFEVAQQYYIIQTHYMPVLKHLIDNGYGELLENEVVQDVVWSTSVQHGVGGAKKLINKVWSGNKELTPRQAVEVIYEERSKVNIYFKGNSKEIRQGVKNRFAKEKQDALNRLEGKSVEAIKIKNKENETEMNSIFKENDFSEFQTEIRQQTKDMIHNSSGSASQVFSQIATGDFSFLAMLGLVIFLMWQSSKNTKKKKKEPKEKNPTASESKVIEKKPLFSINLSGSVVMFLLVAGFIAYKIIL